MKTIHKVLIANRAEIACRIISTLRKMGIKSVAIYSEADRLSRHVRLADEAYYIGQSPSSESYLKGDAIIQIALQCGADAIHPGYGFLSENANFSRKVMASGLIFIGPSPEAMEQMGAKIAAKNTAMNAGVPLVPGTTEAITDLDEAMKVAAGIGFPILVKASAGGGGKGMRIVNTANEFKDQAARAISEAQSSFGDGSVFIEKFVTSPKHIEIQILADQHGNVLYLFERECSVQRRHQKVVEEAPSSAITPEIRAAMGKSAVQLAKTCNYTGAGTVEFLLDEDKNFYFLEMNTRLQVEHPVTEYITGLDLVEWQIRIASGEVLNITQESLKISGHAMELRICAEDPRNNFLPATGDIEEFDIPEGDGIRIDTGFLKGDTVPVYYDSMIAKLIVHAPNRQSAIEKLSAAISQFRIEGIPTTLTFGGFAINHQAFKDGSFDTNFIQNYYDEAHLLDWKEEELKVAGIAATYFYEQLSARPPQIQRASSNWKRRSLK
jgi:acetyl-CoA carboxylase biotin carboxylase subunit